MTLEDIIYTIEETIRAGNDYDSYNEGYQDALFWVSDLLDKLEPSPSWHIEAEESPKEEGTYQVIVRNKDEIVTRGYWEGGDWFLPEKYVSYNVVAWKELPKPCKKDET